MREEGEDQRFEWNVRSHVITSQLKGISIKRVACFSPWRISKLLFENSWRTIVLVKNCGHSKLIEINTVTRFRKRTIYRTIASLARRVESLSNDVMDLTNYALFPLCKTADDYQRYSRGYIIIQFLVLRFWTVFISTYTCKIYIFYILCAGCPGCPSLLIFHPQIT